ncbi:AraC family transcriptional regulator [Serratia surfactantfaciens]|uniref:helix-turn-helix domain-containing protein n=1 Tax=Serratia surfactantfaciens TaxID=2741499 RepID=UPI0018E4A0F1|nr:helix-turn-helix domain-containing protein [Serratia surfactantfaciens]MBI6152222.1 AraC family transcriptional regulator [Serratia surfactantfaciens]
MDFSKDILLKTIEYIEGNIESELSIKDVSSVSGYSKWHLQKLFRQILGIKIGAYIRNRRLSKAAILLKQSQDDIIDVCLSLGFCSQQAFTRSFKNFFGMTPGEFRKNKGWDFAKQLPPYNANSKRLYYYQITIPIDVDCLKKYFSFTYYSTRENISGNDMIFSVNNYIRVRRVMTRFNFSRSDFYYKSNKKVMKNYASTVDKYYLIPEGKYAVIPFDGGVNEYTKFKKIMYEVYLPSMDIKMRDDFFIELHSLPLIYLENDRVCIDFFIPIV